jgi:hypothetical protein
MLGGRVGMGGKDVPKPERKPTVLIPSARLFGSVEYAPYALNSGVRVAAKPNQYALKEPKTTKGNVFPIIHCCNFNASFGGDGDATHLAERSEKHQ